MIAVLVLYLDLSCTVLFYILYLYSRSDTASEWSIIELQGFLESRLQDLTSQHIGDLHFDERVSFSTHKYPKLNIDNI